MPTISIDLNETELKEVIVAGLRATNHIPENMICGPEDVFLRTVTTGYYEDGTAYHCTVTPRPPNKTGFANLPG